MTKFLTNSSNKLFSGLFFWGPSYPHWMKVKTPMLKLNTHFTHVCEAAKILDFIQQIASLFVCTSAVLHQRIIFNFSILIFGAMCQIFYISSSSRFRVKQCRIKQHSTFGAKQYKFKYFLIIYIWREAPEILVR